MIKPKLKVKFKVLFNVFDAVEEARWAVSAANYNVYEQEKNMDLYLTAADMEEATRNVETRKLIAVAMQLDGPDHPDVVAMERKLIAELDDWRDGHRCAVRAEQAMFPGIY